MLEEVINGTPGLWEMTPAVTPLTLTLWSAQLVYGCVGGGGVQVGGNLYITNRLLKEEVMDECHMCHPQLRQPIPASTRAVNQLP